MENNEKRRKYIRQNPNIGREFKDKQLRIVASLNDDGKINMNKIEYITECMVCHYKFIEYDKDTGEIKGKTISEIEKLSNYKSKNGICSHKKDPVLRVANGEILNDRWTLIGVYPEKTNKGEAKFWGICSTCGHQSIHTLDTLKRSNKDTLCKHEFWKNDQIKNIYFNIVKSGKVSKKWYNESIKSTDNLGYVFQEWLIYNTDYLNHTNGRLERKDINKDYDENNCIWVHNNQNIMPNNYTINNTFRYVISVNGYSYTPYEWDRFLGCSNGTIDVYFKTYGLEKTAYYIMNLLINRYYPNLVIPIIWYSMTYY